MKTPRTFRQIVVRILAAIVGLVSLYFGWQERSDLNRVRSIGRPAVVDPIEGYTSHKSRGSTTYTAEFSFKTPDGKLITRRRSFPEELIADFKSGVPVKILYDPGSPSEFVFEKETASWLPLAFGGGFLFVAIFVL